MASQYIAAAAFGDHKTLYLHYRGRQDTFGTLLAIDTSASSIPSTMPPADTRLSLAYQLQSLSASNNISPFEKINGRPLESVSMVAIASASSSSSSSAPPSVKDLLLAYNIPLSEGPREPIFLRYSPDNRGNSTNNSNSKDDQGQDIDKSKGGHWTVSYATQFGTPPSDTVGMMLAPASTTALGDGGAFHQLLVGFPEMTVRKFDFRGASLGLPKPLSTLFAGMSTTPHLIAPGNTGARFETVTVGECFSVDGLIEILTTCLIYTIDSKRLIVPTNMPYEPGMCYTTINDSVVRISRSGIHTFSYGILDSTPLYLSAWKTLQAPSFRQRIQSPLLACASSGSTLYAIAEGNNTVPVLYRLNALPGTSPEWEQIQLVQTTKNISDNNNHNNVVPGGSQSSGLSKGALIGIIVAVLAVLGLLGFGLYWRKRKTGKGLWGKRDEKQQTQDELALQHRHPQSPQPQPASTGYFPAYSESAVLPAVPQSCPFYIPVSDITAGHPQQGHYSHPGAAHRENSELLSMHNQSRPWSPEGTLVQSSSTFNYSPVVHHQEHIPVIATSMSAAPYSSSQPYTTVAPPQSPLPAMRSSPAAIMGDKQELGSDDEEQSYQGTRAQSSAQGFHEQPQPPVLTSGSLQVPPGGANGSVRDGKKPRQQEMMSPALANAQLILQASQHQPQHHQVPPGGHATGGPSNAYHYTN
ncbi:hypothetical protein BGZ94_010377 [Podila epigama]|nr:hypothetical protein BGZ94_010377 [Podila epigama]